MDLLNKLFDIARQRNRKIVLPEGTDARIIAAGARLTSEKIARPVLLGVAAEIARIASDQKVSLAGIETVDPRNDARLQSYGASLVCTRGSMTPSMATRLVSKPIYFGGMMVREGQADAMVAGCANPTRRVIEGGLMTVGLADGITLPSSYFLIIVPDFLRTRSKRHSSSPIVRSMPTLHPPNSLILRSPRREVRRRFSGKRRASPCCHFRPRAAPSTRASTRCGRP